MSERGDFGPMLPGMDFLQNLMKSAGSAMPGMAPWITPTVDPAELDKRIADLRTVQFWLEQNARLIGTTIQALEVQRMTLSTLKNLNLPVADLGAAFRMKEPEVAAPGAAGEAHAPPAQEAAGGPAQSGGAVDPVQWWGALTQQFGEIAVKAMRDGAAAAGGTMAAAAEAARPQDGSSVSPKRRRSAASSAAAKGTSAAARAPGKTTRRGA